MQVGKKKQSPKMVFNRMVSCIPMNTYTSSVALKVEQGRLVLYYNRHFWEKLSGEQQEACVLHELLQFSAKLNKEVEKPKDFSHDIFVKYPAKG